MSSVYEECLTAGVEISHHYSDLYVPVTEKTTKILESHNILGTSLVSLFMHQQHNEPWYDIAFAYLPYWQAVQPHNSQRNDK
jgi:hypothetical protein